MSKKKLIILIAALAVIVLGVVLFLTLGGKKQADTPENLIAGFEMPEIKGTVATDISLNVNADGIGALGTPLSGDMTPVVNVVNNLNFHLLTGENAYELTLRLKDKDLVKASVLNAEDTVKIASDLFTGYLLTMDPAAVQQGGANGASVAAAALTSLSPEEMNNIAAAAATHYQTLKTGLEAKLGEAETGAWAFEGVDFTSRKPLNMTTKELGRSLLAFVRNLFGDPAFAKVREGLGEQFSVEKLDEAIAEFEQRDESAMAVMSAYVYTNAAGNQYFDITFDKNGDVTPIAFGSAGKKVLFRMRYEGNSSVAVTLDTENRVFDLAVNTAEGGTEMAVTVNVAFEKSGAFSGTAAVSLKGTDLLSVTFASSSASEKIDTSVFEGEKKIIALDKLSSDPDAARELTAQLTINAPALLQKANEVMPEDVSKLVTLFMGGGF